MGREQPAEWYDAAFEHPKYAGPVEALPWLPLWSEVASRVPMSAEVVDLGCGAGMLAELLRNRAASYIGYDFSEYAIALARRRCPWASFVVADVREMVTVPACDIVVTSEFLEHIEDDLGALMLVPEGVRVVLSVPSFDDTGHVRWFDDVDGVADRYGSVLRLDEVEALGPWFVAEGVRT